MPSAAKTTVCMLMVAVFTLSALGHVAASDDEDIDKWNILVYLQADNNLNDLTQTDLDELMNVGSTDDVNVLVFMDKLDAPAYLYYIVEGDMITLTYEHNGEEVNTGDPAIFEDFVAFAETEYTAENTLIFFWDHGGPTAGVGVDDTTPEGGSDWLTHQELIDVLKRHPVEVLAMDECSIGQIEVAYEYAVNLENTEYLVASESYIGYRGFPYDWILERLVVDSDMSPYELSLVCVEEFERLFMSIPYKTEILTTQSVIDLGEIQNLAGELGDLVEVLAADISSYKSVINHAQAQAMMPWGARSMGRIDLPTFVEAVADALPSGSTAAKEAADFLEAYELAVPAMGVTMNSEMYGYRGLGTLFPQSSAFLTIAYASAFEAYKTFDFADNGWLQFLEAYWGTDLI